MLRRKRNLEVNTLIRKHVELVMSAVHELSQVLSHYLKDEQAYKEGSHRVHNLESEADRLRFDIEHLLFAGAYLPNQRQDWIDILESLDRVANKAEDASDAIVLMRPPISEPVGENLLEVMNLTVEAFSHVPDLIEKFLLGEFQNVRDAAREMGRVESKVDQLQFDTTRMIYKGKDLDTALKLTLMLFLERLTAVSDQIENLGDCLSLIAIKRRLS